ncbi:MAG: DUF342 domain-containing protein [Lentisphaeria bacterium]|nr:DUF342 domain-containing protein [Lentisphaeria bacterium]
MGHAATGENVIFAPETGEYRAAIDGILELAEGAICVRQTFVVAGDVDMATGNIDFNGSVRIAPGNHGA